jgi:hypothetical protein
MSSMTRCNYCSLLIIESDAKKINCRVIKRKSDGMGLGGIDVYVVPKGEKLTKQNQEIYFRAWFMAIGDRCEC